jgi:hypothetical protein
MQARLAAGLSIVLAAGCTPDPVALPVCNTLVVDAPIVDATAMAAVAPGAAGGTIADGRYRLSAITLYTGPNGSTTAPDLHIAAVFEISGDVIQQAGFINDRESRFTSRYTASGTTLSIVDTCPYSDFGMSSYSATPTTFSIYVAAQGGTLEQVYALSPATPDAGASPDAAVLLDGGI